MKSSLLLSVMLGAALIPAASLADNGADSRAQEFTRESYAMMRDGRLERAMEEQHANRAAFEALRQWELQQRGLQEPTATGSVRRLGR